MCSHALYLCKGAHGYFCIYVHFVADSILGYLQGVFINIFILTIYLNHLHYLSKNSLERIQSSFLELQNILNFIISKSSGNLEHGSGQDQANSTCTYVAHVKDLKDCWYTVLSGVQLHRPEGTSMRPRPICTVEEDQTNTLVNSFVQQNYSINVYKIITFCLV